MLVKINDKAIRHATNIVQVGAGRFIVLRVMRFHNDSRSTSCAAHELLELMERLLNDAFHGTRGRRCQNNVHSDFPADTPHIF